MKMKLKCEKCGYVWTTKSELVLVTCPSCLGKVKRQEKKEGDTNE